MNENLPRKGSSKPAWWISSRDLLLYWLIIKSSLGRCFLSLRGVTEHFTRFAADKILKDACKRVGLVGVSTYSFKRTALTMMSSAWVPLRHIQEISGHNDLGTLQRESGSNTRATEKGCFGDWFLREVTDCLYKYLNLYT